MEQIKLRKGTIVSIMAVFVFVAAFFLNISVFVNADSSNQTASLNGVFLQASADDESGGEGGSLKWGPLTQCDYLAAGSYRQCVSNGNGSSCSPAGSTTCTCGNWLNMGGNCSNF